MDEEIKIGIEDLYSIILKTLAEKGQSSYEQLRSTIKKMGDLTSDFNVYFDRILEQLGYASLIVYVGNLYNIKLNVFELTNAGLKELQSGAKLTLDRLTNLQPLMPALVRGDAMVDWAKR